MAVGFANAGYVIGERISGEHPTIISTENIRRVSCLIVEYKPVVRFRRLSGVISAIAIA